jgi:dihydrofolate reductase
MTKISMIAAMDKNRVIGDGDKIPWHIPEDFKYFKAQTLGKPIVMGRATFESIHAMRGRAPDCPALPQRKNIIITRQNDYAADDCVVCDSVDSAIDAAKKHVDDTNEVMIIGGGTIYKQALPRADRLYITIVDGDYGGDVFFPKFDDRNEWHETSCDRHDGYSFYIYDRII